jgi:hypothetical protein
MMMIIIMKTTFPTKLSAYLLSPKRAFHIPPSSSSLISNKKYEFKTANSKVISTTSLLYAHITCQPVLKHLQSMFLPSKWATKRNTLYQHQVCCCGKVSMRCDLLRSGLVFDYKCCLYLQGRISRQHSFPNVIKYVTGYMTSHAGRKY